MDKVKHAAHSVKLSDEVLCRVAALAAQDVEGVASLSAPRTLQNPTAKPISILPLGGAIAVTAYITVKAGARAVAVASAVQTSIKRGIQDMTGITAVHVHVEITGLGEED